MRLATGIAGIVVLTVAVTGCSDSSAGEPAATSADKIAVVASTNVWGSVVQAVGGDAVSVTSILSDPAADPHSYENRPANATAVSEADLVVFNGGGYDDFFTTLVDTSGQNARKIEAFGVSGKAEGTNEHVWYDLPTVRKMADRIAEELGSIAAAKKGTFTGNATTFGGRIDELIARTEKIGADKPGSKVVCTEPVPEYLLETAGVGNATPEEFTEAVEEETDPPAAAVADITELITGERVAAVINNSQTETPVTTVLKEQAAAAGMPVVDVTETLPDGVTGYLDWMSKQVDALAAALAKT